MAQIISSLSEISRNYKALFVDLWGCVHNGITAYPAAVKALQDYRAQGGIVVLVTNSPKPRAGVAAQLGQFGVPDDAYDTIATSGDSARAAMFTGAVGNKVYFMGEWERDEGFFEPLKVIDNPTEITRVPLAEAEGIVCCGPFDTMADLDVNRPDLLLAKTNGLKLLCANPDIVVDRGEVREWCAGAIAKMYTDMGGESLYFGKPHPPIYDLARRRLAEIGHTFDDSEILAIGDGPHTDIEGAMGEGIDSLFITGGLAASETKTTDQPEAEALAAYLDKEQRAPTYAIGFLR
ncbi:HAD hydrolase [Tritonibacter multivorans]|uniref:HAD hydrolase n=1 Tax=Tritonibacter multivorans TaxID=928856 RepID=A0A0P1G6L2_9RHOB|nr:TIGR01459 family HAD-type hydrolase [Tritonibacter multivorans]MDA7422693.1 TIGR01459 family HAD-type hydrolase [Tritonibacter multivorans]CUH77247.1 HAD hydrolase [Tritonibacter multivorans]SFD53107.1 HAD-superfamily class IIA hydrolase, TIGR01459 [Tritonibacter multivorans]